MMPQQYCLRWKHHHSNVQNMFAQLLEKERFCDVTLYCSPSFAAQVPNKDTVEPQSIRGVSLRAHRVVLAACSELLGTLLGAHEAHGEPVLVIDGAEPKHLKALLDYMYTGEMNVHHSQLASLLKTAEELRIKGLTDIRWNNKDEPPDCASVATTTVPKPDKQEPPPKDPEPKKQDIKKPPEVKKQPDLKKQEIPKKQTDVKKLIDVKKQLEAKLLQRSPDRTHMVTDIQVSEPKTLKDEERFNVNGGPPPLIKLPLPKSISTPKREHSDSDTPSPKRQRLASGTENTDDETNCVPKTERDPEQWHHGNMDISAMRVDAGWGGSASSDEEWADAPADIGSFLHTRLRVDGDNSADEESNDSAPSQVQSSRPESVGSTGPNPTPPLKDPLTTVTLKRENTTPSIATIGPKSGPSDNRFNDVIRLHDYLQHGRRPQFWEEHYVKRVMEAVRLKELEMKQAAEILGVSYGTLYGRYRDVYGCINRPYRAVRDFWQVKGPSEVLERLQRGEISLDTAANALGVSVPNLAAHVADFPANQLNQIVDTPEFEPIPIEVDSSLRTRTYSGSASAARKATPTDKPGLVKIAPKVVKCLNPVPPDNTEFEPIPIEMDPSLCSRTYSGSAPAQKKPTPTDKPVAAKLTPKVVKCLNPNASDDDDAIPAHIISTENKDSSPTGTTGAKWSGIRVASIESLRSSPPPASPSQLMRTRPDLTIVAKKPETRDDT